MRIPSACSLLIALAWPGAAAGQDEAVVDVLARVLRSEDTRLFDASVMAEAVGHAEHIIRRRAALAIGRIGDPAGTTMLLDLLGDQSTVVRQDAAFALGLMSDPSSFDRLRQLILEAEQGTADGTHTEAITAVAKLANEPAVDLFAVLLQRWVGRVMAGADPPNTLVQALSEAWRLGRDAPVTLLVQFTEAESDAIRQAAFYSLGRLRAPQASNAFLRGVDDPNPLVRSWSVRALTAALADSAGLDPSGTARWVTPLLEDPDPHVRTNALRTLGSYADPTFTPMVVSALADVDANVRVQALATLGRIGGSEAAAVLAGAAEDGPFAQRREALLGLARASRDAALVECAAWITQQDWLIRATGAEALGVVGGDTALVWLEDLTRDLDGRVVGKALSALGRVDSASADAAARTLIAHEDAVVRTMAANRIVASPLPSDVALLVQAYDLAVADAMSDARIATVRALGAVAELGYSQRVAVEDQFLNRYPETNDYLVKRASIVGFPAAAAQWGPVTPIETGRNLDDYRAIARQLVLPAEEDGELPILVIETDRGRIVVELAAADAPITVEALLRLADQHYFDGNIWHRVVPNFVVQDGDPRGDGWGGPGFALRDENGRVRYARGVMGMALAGPDTGGSQFFITHSPQPHLDGTYPVVGQVVEGMEVVDRIIQGDRIRTIRRR